MGLISSPHFQIEVGESDGLSNGWNKEFQTKKNISKEIWENMDPPIPHSPDVDVPAKVFKVFRWLNIGLKQF